MSGFGNHRRVATFQQQRLSGYLAPRNQPDRSMIGRVCDESAHGNWPGTVIAPSSRQGNLRAEYAVRIVLI